MQEGKAGIESQRFHPVLDGVGTMARQLEREAQASVAQIIVVGEAEILGAAEPPERAQKKTEARGVHSKARRNDEAHGRQPWGEGVRSQAHRLGMSWPPIGRQSAGRTPYVQSFLPPGRSVATRRRGLRRP